MSYSQKEVIEKLKSWGQYIGFKSIGEYRVKFPNIDRDLAYVDCVWFTQTPVEAPVVGFEVRVNPIHFTHFKKMKADIMNLLLLNPRLGILAVNESGTKIELPTWYEKVDSYKKALKAIANPIPLKVVDVTDIMTEKVPWRILLKEIGLKLIQ